MSEQIDFRFQFSSSSPYLPLLKYLSPKNKKLEFPRQNMILWALVAFWYPVACKWWGGFSESDLKSKARTAIYQLQQQIIYLATTFNLETELETHTLVNHSIQSALPSLVNSRATLEQNQGDVDTHLSQLDSSNNDDDSLLENAFN